MPKSRPRCDPEECYRTSLLQPSSSHKNWLRCALLLPLLLLLMLTTAFRAQALQLPLELRRTLSTRAKLVFTVRGKMNPDDLLEPQLPLHMPEQHQLLARRGGDSLNVKDQGRHREQAESSPDRDDLEAAAAAADADADTGAADQQTGGHETKKSYYRYDVPRKRGCRGQL